MSIDLAWSCSSDQLDRFGDATSQTPNNQAKDVLTLTVRARLQRVGREMKMLVETPMIRQKPILHCYESSLEHTISKSA